MKKQKVCVIDCGSDKTKDIIRIVENSGFEVDRWYLYYPSINFKLDIKSNFSSPKLLQIKEEKLTDTVFDNDFTKKYDYLILSGGGLLQGIQEEIIKFFKYLTQIEIPVLGICFGHQVIALVHGAELYRIKDKVKGNYKVKYISSSRIIDKSITNDKLLFNKNHTEAICLPNKFEHLASSDTCKIEMMQHQTKDIFGTQFHPEVSAKHGEKIILNFLKIQ